MTSKSRTRYPGRRVLTGVVVAALGALVAGGSAQAAADPVLGFDAVADKGSLWQIAEAVGAHASYAAGLAGKGVGVALIDTGVTEVPGLDTGNVRHGPDLSFDSQDPELAHLDAYGHGTHLASIIAGRDVDVTSPKFYNDPTRFNGIAPDATLVSVKVGASDGAVDVSQVIAGINWVVEHKDDPGLNIRVINLSYGTDSTQSSMVDPLAFAVENAWRSGIVVVVAGGNDGSDILTLANPASSPYVIAAGVADTRGTVTPVDDVVPAWGTRGTNSRHVDLVAPGVSVLGLRVPNGYADERHPDARVGSRFARASGTSQAAAVLSGEVALLLQRYPRMTPDQVKRQVMSTADSFDSTSNQYRGNGLGNARKAQLKDPNSNKQPTTFYGDGTGSLEAARGSSHVTDGVSDLKGEVDIFGNPWDAGAYSQQVQAGTIWSGGSWRGATWTGNGWDGRMWRDAAWASGTWSGRMWRDDQWAGRMWRDGTWSGRMWRDGTWTGRMWREANWSGRMWREADLSTGSWS